MISYVRDIAINCIHFLKTTISPQAKRKSPQPAYENEVAINRLISTFPDHTRLWLESVYNSSSAERV